MALEWGVLGIARIACTLATNRIVSKRAAGEWALDIYPDLHHAAIRDALAARCGAASGFPLPRFDAALAFMEIMIEAETPTCLGVRNLDCPFETSMPIGARGGR